MPDPCCRLIAGTSPFLNMNCFCNNDRKGETVLKAFSINGPRVKNSNNGNVTGICVTCLPYLLKIMHSWTTCRITSNVPLHARPSLKAYFNLCVRIYRDE